MAISSREAELRIYWDALQNLSAARATGNAETIREAVEEVQAIEEFMEWDRLRENATRRSDAAMIDVALMVANA